MSEERCPWMTGKHFWSLWFLRDGVERRSCLWCPAYETRATAPSFDAGRRETPAPSPQELDIPKLLALLADREAKLTEAERGRDDWKATADEINREINDNLLPRWREEIALYEQRLTEAEATIARVRTAFGEVETFFLALRRAKTADDLWTWIVRQDGWIHRMLHQVRALVGERPTRAEGT